MATACTLLSITTGIPLLRQIKAARGYLKMPAHCSIANQLNFCYGVGSPGLTPVLFTAHRLASKVNLAC